MKLLKQSDFKIIPKRFPHEGRCVHCDGKPYCGLSIDKNFTLYCFCNMTEHYINIKTERRLKLQKLKWQN